MARLTKWTDERLQRLFDRYNRLYWSRKLPRYSVYISDHFNGGMCFRREREIILHSEAVATDREVRATLLHEMAHAATRRGHGTQWRQEMRRLCRAGAPIDSRDLESGEGEREMLAAFYDCGLQNNLVGWTSACKYLGYLYGLVDSRNRPMDTQSVRLLKIAKAEFRRGGQRQSRKLTSRQSPQARLLAEVRAREMQQSASSQPPQPPPSLK